MTACPTCGHEPGAKHRFRSELDMQYPAHALELRQRAEATAETPEPIGQGLIGWRGLAWHRIRCRKPAVCVRSGDPIAAGAFGWRQLSVVKGRDQRVADAAWPDGLKPTS